MSAKLIVGYRMRKIEDGRLAAITPEFQPSKTIGEKNLEKQAENVAAQLATFQADCRDWAYTGTFDSVVIADPRNERINRWDYAGREPGGKKPPICLAVAGWLLKEYPNAWNSDTYDPKNPEAIFLGFDMRIFLKVLGIECSLPEHNRPLPPRMWIGNSEHRDIEELILPKDFAKVTFLSALKRRRPQDETAAAKWDKTLAGWKEAHVDPVVDVWLATELATQIGYLDD